jgi:hypothetical protein
MPPIHPFADELSHRGLRWQAEKRISDQLEQEAKKLAAP